MPAQTVLEDLLHELAQGHDPVLDVLAQMNVGALDQADLDEQTALVARFAALVALDAAPASYLVHLALAEQAGLQPATFRATLATLAPLVGSARVVSAANNILQAIQLANR